IAWCRGGLGAALATLRLDQPNSPAVKRLVRDAAADGPPAHGSYPLCLCHGLLGMLEFIEVAARAGVPEARALARRVRSEVLGRIYDGELCSDHAHGLEMPGLMTGLA